MTINKNQFQIRKKFIENEDYYYLTPENIKTNEIRTIGITSPRGGYLITESGYLMLVKSFTDDLSWKVQRQLVCLKRRLLHYNP